MSNNQETNMEVMEYKGFAALENMDILNEAMSDECAGLEFTFDRVKVPAGGGTAFEVPAEDGEDSEMVKEITGVIVYNHPVNAYYHDKYQGGNNPPDCGSFDGKVGVGMPGGSCAHCPYNKFGSGEGQSKMCKNKRMLYILREGELFPIILSLPSGSLKSFTNYVKGQLTRGRKVSQVVTKITLKKATNASGIAFSQAVFSFIRMLDTKENQVLAGVIETVKTYAANLTPASLVDDDVPEIPFVDPETGEIMEPLK